MSLSEQYRIKAEKLRARAHMKSDIRLKLELEMLAQGYQLLAEQAARNDRTDIVDMHADGRSARGK